MEADAKLDLIRGTLREMSDEGIPTWDFMWGEPTLHFAVSSFPPPRFAINRISTLEIGQLLMPLSKFDANRTLVFYTPTSNVGLDLMQTTVADIGGNQQRLELENYTFILVELKDDVFEGRLIKANHCFLGESSFATILEAVREGEATIFPFGLPDFQVFEWCQFSPDLQGALRYRSKNLWSDDIENILSRQHFEEDPTVVYVQKPITCEEEEHVGNRLMEDYIDPSGHRVVVTLGGYHFFQMWA